MSNVRLSEDRSENDTQCSGHVIFSALFLEYLKKAT